MTFICIPGESVLSVQFIDCIKNVYFVNNTGKVIVILLLLHTEIKLYLFLPT